MTNDFYFPDSQPIKCSIRFLFAGGENPLTNPWSFRIDVARKLLACMLHPNGWQNIYYTASSSILSNLETKEFYLRCFMHFLCLFPMGIMLYAADVLLVLKMLLTTYTTSNKIIQTCWNI